MTRPLPRSLDCATFVATYGHVFEHSPRKAEILAAFARFGAAVGRTDAATGILLDFLCHHQGAADARVTPAVAA